MTRAFEHLRVAIQEARYLGVVQYEDYRESPISSLFETLNRIEKTSEKALATAMREEIREEK